MTLYKNMYRIESTRCPYWNYGADGIYFVTICTKHMKPYLGEIKHNKMIHSRIGKIASAELLKTVMIRKYIHIDEYVIMPNHIHILINIDKTNNPVTNMYGANTVNSLIETHGCASLRGGDGTTLNRFGPQRHNLASVIRAYKCAVQKYANNNNIPFAWQPRYHDRIIRDEIAHDNVAKYIRENVRVWGRDTKNIKRDA